MALKKTRKEQSRDLDLGLSAPRPVALKGRGVLRGLDWDAHLYTTLKSGMSSFEDWHFVFIFCGQW